jgi:hypothetical protein
MTTKKTPATATDNVQTSTPPTLPPVPGGGSWRPNAAGDGWVENLPAKAETAPETDSKTISPE